MLDGSPTAAHWLSTVADVETSTAREWIRIGRILRRLPLISAAFAAGQISYSKVPMLISMATSDNEVELLAIAVDVAAGELGRAIAVWFNRNNDPEDIDALHQRPRAVKRRCAAGPKPSKYVDHASADASAWPSLAQQPADAIETFLTDGAGIVNSKRTHTDELELRCAPCHHTRHAA